MLLGGLTFTQHQLHELNVSWNTVYRVIFGFNRWESVKCFIHGLGRLNLIFIIKLYRINFFFRLLQLDHALLYNIFLFTCVITIVLMTVYFMYFKIRQKP
jgi:hypothetical protein